MAKKTTAGRPVERSRSTNITILYNPECALLHGTEEHIGAVVASAHDDDLVLTGQCTIFSCSSKKCTLRIMCGHAHRWLSRYAAILWFHFWLSSFSRYSIWFSLRRFFNACAGSKSDLDFSFGLSVVIGVFNNNDNNNEKSLECAPWIVNRVAYRIPWAAFAGDWLCGDMQIAFNNNGIVHNSILLNLPSIFRLIVCHSLTAEIPNRSLWRMKRTSSTHNLAANTNICYYLSLLCHANVRIKRCPHGNERHPTHVFSAPHIYEIRDIFVRFMENSKMSSQLNFYTSDWITLSTRVSKCRRQLTFVHGTNNTNTHPLPNENGESERKRRKIMWKDLRRRWNNVNDNIYGRAKRLSNTLSKE